MLKKKKNLQLLEPPIENKKPGGYLFTSDAGQQHVCFYVQNEVESWGRLLLTQCIKSLSWVQIFIFNALN